MKAATALVALNRGIVSRLALARTDVKRLAMAAQTMTNWIPRVLGPMMLRPGWKYIGATYTNAAARVLKFVFATNDTALLELTGGGVMRVWISDTNLLTRPTVTTTITNGTFAGNITGWDDLDEAGATSSYLAPNIMLLAGNGTARAIREQQLTVTGTNIGREHGIRVTVYRGPVLMRIGSTSGDDDYAAETSLAQGSHSISIVPTGNFFIRFFTPLTRLVGLSSVTIESGVVALPTPWVTADLSNIRCDQSGDVVFVACKGYQPRRIERRGTRPNARSWSVALYQPDDGPYKVANVEPITLTPSALTGYVSLTSSKPMFKTTHVGALFSVTSTGQNVTATGAANGVTTASIRIVGVGDDRPFAIIISGNATGSTVTLQRSYDNSNWANLTSPTPWTADATTSFDDGLSNQIVYYRLILTTRVAPDSVVMDLRCGVGSVRGLVRINDYVSTTVVNVQVLADLGGTGAYTDWQEGMWSDRLGWPTSVKLHEGRLWWAGLNGIWGSIADAFDSFDETFVGDAGPINRTIGAGPVDTINWLMSLKGLLLGAQGAEFTARSSSLDEPLTPTNFNCKSTSTQGSGAVDGVKADQAGYFVNRSSTKLFELAFDLKSYDYVATNLMELVPEIGQPSIVRMDVQRLPDTRVHCVLSDGTVALAVMNKTEDMLAWVKVTTSGFVEDVVILPAVDGDRDDQVYYVVRRTINGSTVRYLEKWAQEEDCVGGALSFLADSYVSYTGTSSTISVPHLEGQQVVVWADGADVGTVTTARPWTQLYTVSGGVITLAVAASNVVVGLPYTAQFQSTKLGLLTDASTPLNVRKHQDHIGLVLVDSHPQGLKFGPTLDDTGSLRMDDMPEIEDGTAVNLNTVRSTYDEDRIEFPGTWTTDMRVCLQAQAPRPVTVLGISIELEQSS